MSEQSAQLGPTCWMCGKAATEWFAYCNCCGTRHRIEPLTRQVAELTAQRDELLTCLKEITGAWNSIDPEYFVPAEMNNHRMWDRAGAIIAKLKGQPQ